jgi:sarcosine oxidase gamma subunit
MADTLIRDMAANWPDVPDWKTATLEGAGLVVKTIGGLGQHLVSGNLDAYAKADGVVGTGIGALAVADGERYALRQARDRMLVINARPKLGRPGWYPAGFAVSDISAALHVFEISGPGIAALLGEALAIDPDKGGPSAAVVFAGLAATLYHHQDRDKLRLHVDRGSASHIWTWLSSRHG